MRYSELKRQYDQAQNWRYWHADYTNLDAFVRKKLLSSIDYELIAIIENPYDCYDKVAVLENHNTLQRIGVALTENYTERQFFENHKNELDFPPFGVIEEYLSTAIDEPEHEPPIKTKRQSAKDKFKKYLWNCSKITYMSKPIGKEKIRLILTTLDDNAVDKYLSQEEA